jgi:hypothetical protein
MSVAICSRFSGSDLDFRNLSERYVRWLPSNQVHNHLQARMALPLNTNDRIDHLKLKGCSSLSLRGTVVTVEKVFIDRALVVAASIVNSSVGKQSKTKGEIIIIIILQRTEFNIKMFEQSST